ncbi:MAG: TatD family hydrolase [Nanoarchaeota archaeon]
MYIDIHAHLDFDSFDSDREKLVKELEMKKILTFTNTLSFENYLKTKEMFSGVDCVKVCPGLYPQEAESISEKEFEDYLKYLKKHKSEFLAIGEVGVDFKHTKDKGLQNVQVERFKKIANLAYELDKPLIIHSRKAEREVLEILEEFISKTKFSKFVLHCFSGKKKLIKKIKELKLYVSIPLLIQNTESFRILVEELPVNQILVETDSPFLKPGRERNTPLSVPLIYEEIAKIKGLDNTEIKNIIFRNYQRLTL